MDANGTYNLKEDTARNRAYMLLDHKAIDEPTRTITGVASTPSADRMGDVVEPLGAVFEMPMPLLHQHWHERPVGWVEFAKPTKTGIPYKARIDTPEDDDPQPLKDRINTAWKEVKRKLVRGVSIGFNPLEWSYMDGDGVRFTKWEWLELSLVTIPANAEATIQTIKAMNNAGLRRSKGGVLLLERRVEPVQKPEGGAVRLVKASK